jgi:hypothetical protein
MSHKSTYSSQSLVHLCNDSPASSTRIVSYNGRQYAPITVLDVDIVGSSKCHNNGNETNPIKDSTFSMVVSMDTVRLFFLLVALNNLEILAADIQNAYLNAPVRENLNAYLNAPVREKL